MRWLQPDTLVPQPNNPQSWNRYSYVQNNPIRYNDPSGHMMTDDKDGGLAAGGYTYVIEKKYRWKLKGKWGLDELKTIYQTAQDIESYADDATGGSGLDWMHYALGNTTIDHVDFKDGHSDTWPFLGGNLGPRIRLNDNWLNDGWGANVVFAHELGHVWDINSGFKASGELNKGLGGSSWCFFCAPGKDVPQWGSLYHRVNGDAYGNSQRNEYFAEAFSATIYNVPDNTPLGVSEWMHLQMSTDLIEYLFSPGQIIL